VLAARYRAELPLFPVTNSIRLLWGLLQDSLLQGEAATSFENCCLRLEYSSQHMIIQNTNKSNLIRY